MTDQRINYTVVGMSVDVDLSIGDAEEAVRSALADEGFGVVSEIDVAATLKTKLDIDRPAYKILGACDPALANEALEHDEQIGLLLPCNVTLSDNGSGTTVSVVDPVTMVSVANSDGKLDALSSGARTRLERALSTLIA